MNWQQAREELLKNDAVQKMIAERAYHISESRGFEAGYEAEDWFRAEGEIINYLLREMESSNASDDGHVTENSVLGASALVESAINEEPVSHIEAAADTQAEPEPKPRKTSARKTSSASGTTKSTARKTTTKSTAAKSTKSASSKKASSRRSTQPEQSSHSGD